MKSIGKECFILYICPELLKDQDITYDDIARKYPTYAGYKLENQKSRLSTSKRIFREGNVTDALRLILDSGRLDEHVRELAKAYLKDAVKRNL